MELISQPFPKWARLPTDRMTGLAHVAAFAAGASLAALDVVMRSETVPPAVIGALQARQALSAAAACVRIARLREDEEALRDALRLAASDDNASPAGCIHLLWRLFRAPKLKGDAGDLARAGHLLGATADVAALADAIHHGASHPGDPLGPALAAGQEAMHLAGGALHGDAAETLALWVADLVLARRLGWARPIPLLATRVTHPSLFIDSRRARPADSTWPAIATQAYARAAADAHARALQLARRAEKLLEIAPKLRARGAGRVVDMLLGDDSVTASAAARASGMSDRAARRLFDRLVALGAARELTRRATFRIYGL